MAPPLILKGGPTIAPCNHQGFLVPTVFREVVMPDGVKVLMTVQAFCISCRQNIKFEMPKEEVPNAGLPVPL